MNKIKQYIKDNQEKLVYYTLGAVVGATTMYFFGKSATKHKIEGMELANIVAKIKDSNFLVHLDFKDGCWQEYGWDIERMQQAALEAAAQDTQTV